jgi:prepilin-type N-terminal cleavage/methylation domain-containing protein
MTHKSSPVRRLAAFTLIELLVVITIIAVLMSLLIPAAITATDKARQAQARTDALNIVAAVKQYYTEYGKYPEAFPTGNPPASGADTAVGDPVEGMANNNCFLFNILRNRNADPNVASAQNPRQVIYIETKQVQNALAPKSGFMDSPNGPPALLGCFFDPWGKQYNIVMDANYDGMINIDAYYTDFATPNSPAVGVGVFSMGRDNLPGNNGDHRYQTGTVKSDDIISWQ